MKIIFVAPQSITLHRHQNTPFRFDYGFWNFYLPLLSLGHDVKFFDSSVLGNRHLKKMIGDFKPDLLFCVMTGSPLYCPDEPWETVIEETRKGNIKTFNWYCDDSWRFEDFSSRTCKFFHHCSTPEKKFLENYKEIGYDNIHYAPWHANSDLYSRLKEGSKRHPRFSFVGALRGDRKTAIDLLESKGNQVHTPQDTSFEDMLWAYSSSFAALNFSKNSTNKETQMKARMFEVPATGALLVTEYSKDLENCYNIGREIVTFSTEDQLLGIAEDINYHRNMGSRKYEKIAERGYERFLKDHDSKVRLKKLLEDIQ